jgi:dolichol-phosphate mannosyltransferase
MEEHATVSRKIPGVALSVVVPCFNEEECLVATYTRLWKSIRSVGIDSFEIIFVNDGSTDKTIDILVELSKTAPRLVIVDLSRNHGHQLALTAGLSVAHGERIFIIDADLQDPPELLSELMVALDNGADVAYGVRRTRKGESFFKRATAKVFYKLLARSSGVEIPVDTGDFRLMTRQVLDVVLAMPEAHRFIRGMVAWAGFRQVPVEYDRQSRYAGTSKYPVSKMLGLAIDAVTAFAVAPLRFVYWVAILSALVAGLLLVWSLISYFYFEALPGWSSLMVVMLAFMSLQLFALGVIGDYVGRIFIQTKGRPLFVIKRITQSPPTIDQ